MLKVAIFASGRGSNALKIIEHSASKTTFEVALIVSNKSEAPILLEAHAAGIPTLILEKERFYKTTEYSRLLKARGIDAIVLAGFLWLIPIHLIQSFEGKIINIHPSLLPKYGGKGMYGSHIHEAVSRAKERRTGITIHYVNEEYDKGKIILQACTQIDEHDTPAIIAQKVLRLEHYYFPRAVEGLAYHLAQL